MNAIKSVYVLKFVMDSNFPLKSVSYFSFPSPSLFRFSRPFLPSLPPSLPPCLSAYFPAPLSPVSLSKDSALDREIALDGKPVVRGCQRPPVDQSLDTVRKASLKSWWKSVHAGSLIR